MSYFLHSAYCTMEEHIGSLEDLYAECFLDEVDITVLVEIQQQIKCLEKMIRDRQNALAIHYVPNKTLNSYNITKSTCD